MNERGIANRLFTSSVTGISATEGFYFLIPLLTFLNVSILGLIGAANLGIIPQTSPDFPASIFLLISFLKPECLFPHF